MYLSQNWSSNIQRLLVYSSFTNSSLLNSDSSTTSNGNPSRPAGYLARSSRHPPGTIWRKFVAKCVFFDLLKGVTVPQRRIVRMDETGLGAILMYEFADSKTPGSKDSETLCWTIDNVFGCSDDLSEHGMGEEEFLNQIQVRVVYSPLYACTSFVAGQVMNALITKTDIQPIPAPGGLGFAVASESFTFFDHGLSRSSLALPDLARKVLRRIPASDCAPRFLRDKATWLEDDPGVDALEMDWVQVHLFSPDNEDEDEVIKGHSSIESFDELESEDASSELNVSNVFDNFNSSTFDSINSISPSQSLSTSSSVDIATSLEYFASRSECSFFTVQVLEPSTSFEADIGDVSICSLISDLDSSSSVSSLYLGPLTPSKPPHQRSGLVDVHPLIKSDCDQFTASLHTSGSFTVKPLITTSDSNMISDGDLFDTLEKEDSCGHINALKGDVGHPGKSQRLHGFGRGKENIPPPPARA